MTADLDEEKEVRVMRDRLLASPATSRWLKATLRSGWRRDPNEVVVELAILSWLMEERCRSGVRRAGSGRAYIGGAPDARDKPLDL